MDAEVLIINEKVQQLSETVGVFSHLLPSCNERGALTLTSARAIIRENRIRKSLFSFFINSVILSFY